MVMLRLCLSVRMTIVRQMDAVVPLSARFGHDLHAHIVINGRSRDKLFFLQLRRKVVRYCRISTVTCSIYSPRSGSLSHSGSLYSRRYFSHRRSLAATSSFVKSHMSAPLSIK